ncbi:hypothetical protein ACWGB8_15920 [Kitasatospora sp. NPDC054939]
MSLGPPQTQADSSSTFDPGQETPQINFGVHGSNGDGPGLLGSSATRATTGPGSDGAIERGAGVLGVNVAAQGIGVHGFCGQGTGVSGRGGGDNPGVSGKATAGPGVSGTSAKGPGVSGASGQGVGVLGRGAGFAAGVSGAGESGPGVEGVSERGTGVRGVSTNVDEAGVSGTDHEGTGVLGNSDSGPGVAGVSRNGVGMEGFGGGSSAGVAGSGSGGPGVSGQSETGPGLLGRSTQGVGASGTGGGSSAGVSGTGTAGPGVSGQSQTGPGLRGTSAQDAGVSGSSGGAGPGVIGASTSGPGVSATSQTGSGMLASTPGAGTGIFATSFDGLAVLGRNGHSDTEDFGFGFAPNTGPAVMGASFHGAGVHGMSLNGIGVRAEGVTGLVAQGSTLGARIVGNVVITGSLSKGGGGFRIDHPLDPENRFLSHSFVESPEMKNVYDGVVTLDADGRAEVSLPEWFEALNESVRYQLTPVGAAAPELHVSRKLADNSFSIAGGDAGLEVCWQVTGVRRDAWARANPVGGEEEKAPEECGLFLYPEAFGEPPERSIAAARDPETVVRTTEGEQ